MRAAITRMGGPTAARRSAAGIFLPTERNAAESELPMPGQESISVPSRSNIREVFGLTALTCIGSGALSLAIKNRPALLKHVNSLGVLLLNLAIIISLVEQPEELKMNRVQKTLINVFFFGGVRVEDDFSRLEAGEMDVDHLTQNRNRVAGNAAPNHKIEPTRFARRCRLEHAVGDLCAVNRVPIETSRERKIDATEDDPSKLDGLFSRVGHGLKLSVGGDRLKIE